MRQVGHLLNIYRYVQFMVVKSLFLLECHERSYSGCFCPLNFTHSFKPGNNLTAVCWQLSFVVPAERSLHGRTDGRTDERTNCAVSCRWTGMCAVSVASSLCDVLLCEVRGKERSYLVTLVQRTGLSRKNANCCFNLFQQDDLFS